jgi:hypothetical protein
MFRLLRRTSSFVAMLLAGVLGCEEEKPLMAPQLPEPQLGEAAQSSAEVAALGSIPLPVNQTFSGPELAFGITQTGTGRVGLFRINNASNAMPVLTSETNAASSLSAAFVARTTGLGVAGRFAVSNTANSATALEASTNGTGTAIFARTTGRGTAVGATSTGLGPAITATASGGGAGGVFQVVGNTVLPAIRGTSSGGGPVAWFSTGAFASNGGLLVQTNSGTAGIFSTTGGAGLRATVAPRPGARSGFNALEATVLTGGDGWAGVFRGTTKGVQISLASIPGVGLQVLNGTKSAVVNTPAGARALYSEEATEVWFSDYGFGRLTSGRARILIDPDFAQTVSLDRPYHVFIQPYGRAEIYVAERTNLGFVVVLKDGDPAAEFGYRVVAKRNGFESERLAQAQWVAKNPGLDGRED